MANRMIGSSDEKHELLNAKDLLQAGSSTVGGHDKQKLVTRLSNASEPSSALTRNKNKPSRGHVTEPLSVLQNFPKPAAQSFVNRKPSNLGLANAKRSLPKSEAVRATFQSVQSFAGVAATFLLDYQETLRALAEAEIDIYWIVAEDWSAGIPIRELSRRHGVGRDTIARWIKKAGKRINPGNSNHSYYVQVIIEAYRQTNSANRAAKAAGVSWETARKVLRNNGMWSMTRKAQN